MTSKSHQKAVVDVCVVVCLGSVSDVVSLVTKIEVPQHLHMLEMFPSFAEDEDCETVPPIRYLFR